MADVTPIRPDMKTLKKRNKRPARFDIWRVTDEVRCALAILNVYIESIPDERADDRYVLWTVRDKLEAAANIP